MSVSLFLFKVSTPSFCFDLLLDLVGAVSVTASTTSARADCSRTGRCDRRPVPVPVPVTGLMLAAGPWTTSAALRLGLLRWIGNENALITTKELHGHTESKRTARHVRRRGIFTEVLLLCVCRNWAYEVLLVVQPAKRRRDRCAAAAGGGGCCGGGGAGGERCGICR